MDLQSLVRHPEKVLSDLKELGDKIVTTNGCKVYFPKRFAERELAEVGNHTEVVGILGIVVEDKYYATLNVLTRVVFNQDETSSVDIDGEPYYVLTFRPGSTVIPDVNCMRQDTLVYYVCDMFISKGRVPWYMNYTDMCNLLNTADKYAGAGQVVARPEIVDLLISLVARDADNPSVYYRQVKDDPKYNKPPMWIPLKSVDHGATDTVTKLAGSYLEKGVVSSLVDPTTQISNLSKILMK